MDYVLMGQIFGAEVLLVGAGLYFLKVSDPCCVEDFVDLGEI